MASLKERLILLDAVMVVAVVVAVQFFGFSSGCSSGCPSTCPPGVRYQVGSVWSIPPSPNFYANWSSSHFFRTGDSLSFDFETGHNDVIQVSRQEYESCTACNPFNVMNIGPAIVPLTQKGVLYFISNFSNFCALGLKTSVNVHECSDVSHPTPRSSHPQPPVVPPSSSPAPSPHRSNGTHPPVPSPAPSSNGYPPEAAAAPSDRSMALALGRFGTGSLGNLWAIELCMMVFVILG
ncbi:Blue copper protein [Morella rubra]|uniref:Blue copper protein n=1 Tax=Morella rubra TaxID=262757 RepID=A0A6A1WNY0_9ROSI|nr:Blue copper protein [Morella rubra]